MAGTTQLHQVNALIKGVKQRALRTTTDVYHNLQKAPLLSGISRTYTPYADDGEALPAESTHVQITAAAALPQVVDALGHLFNLQLTQDVANSTAAADIVVDGVVIMRAVPVTYLLFLEKQLVDLRTLIAALPTLDPAERWHYDPARNCWASEPAVTVRTKKTPRNHVLAEATDRHPAQVHMYSEDVPQGTWSTTKLSGAMPAAATRSLRLRVDQLIDAVKIARETANAAALTARTDAGPAVFDWLFPPDIVG